MSGSLRQELNDLKAQVIDLSAQVCTLEEASRRFMIAVAKMTGDMADIKANMATKGDISSLNARMDGFAGLLEDSRRRWAVHADVLARHDERLNKLEKRRSS